MRDALVFLLGSLFGGLVVFGVSKVSEGDEHEVYQRNLRELQEQRRSLEEHTVAFETLARKTAERAGIQDDQSNLVN